MNLSTAFVTLTQCETDIANFALSDSMSGLFRSSIRTTVATARRRLDEAFGFLQRGNFAAVLDVLPDLASPFAAVRPSDVLEQATLVRPLARFYSAWDRLDYKGALHVDLLPSLGMRVAGATRLRDTRTRWDKFVPSAAVRGWVQSLAEDLPDDARTRAGRLRLLAADLLANGERRLRDQQFEDAIIRAYRVLELVGQIRLCDQGIHSDDVPADHPIVQAFQDKLAKNNSNGMGRGPGGRLFASREQVARLLKDFKDPLAQRLLDLGMEDDGNPLNEDNTVAFVGARATSTTVYLHGGAGCDLRGDPRKGRANGVTFLTVAAFARSRTTRTLARAATGSYLLPFA